jgi:hypothetical protein
MTIRHFRLYSISEGGGERREDFISFHEMAWAQHAGDCGVPVSHAQLARPGPLVQQLARRPERQRASLQNQLRA